MNGNDMFEGDNDDMEEVALSIIYLQEADEGVQSLKNARLGEGYTVQIDFEAIPRPHFEDIFWMISGPDGKKKLYRLNSKRKSI